MAALLTNTWTSGMNTDTNLYSLLPNQYRYAQNIRVVTNDSGNTGSIQPIDYIKQYLTYINLDEVIIGATSVNTYDDITLKNINTAIVFTKVLSSNVYSYNKVYRITGFDTASPVITNILKADLQLCVSDDNTNLTIIPNYESETNIKVYFTDGNSLIKVLNVMSDDYIGTSSTNTLLDSNGLLLDPLILDITPSALLKPFTIDSLGVGSLATGVISYCYQLFNVRSNQTVTSPLSNTIHLVESSTTSPSLDYEGSKANISSGKSCLMSVTLNNFFDKCRIISIQYTSNNSDPIIYIVDEIDLEKGLIEIKYNDTGNTILSELTVAEFNALLGTLFTAKTLAKKNNILFAANITETTFDPEYDARAYRSNSSGIVKLDSNNMSESLTFNLGSYDLTTIPKNHDCINPFNSLQSTDMNATNSYEYGGYTGSTGILSKGGIGPNVSYRFITAPLGLAYTSNNAVTHLIPDNVSMSMPTHNYNYTIVDLANNSAVSSTLSDSYVKIPNYADPYISAYYRSYQRDEVYRFGIIFYNNKSVASPVHWIGDIRMPHAADELYIPITYGSMTYNGTSGTTVISEVSKANPLGIKFTISNIPDGVASFEIVRCDRTENDRSIIALVAVSRLGKYTREDKNNNLGSDIELRPSIMLSYCGSSLKFTDTEETHDGIFYADEISDDYIQLISPEICVGSSNIISLATSGVYLDTLYGLISPILNDHSSTEKIFANADRIMNYEGDNINVSSNIKYYSSGTFNSASSIFLNDEGDGSSVNISKYYIPIQTILDNITIGKLNISISKLSEVVDIPYNGVIDLSGYYTLIDTIAYINFSATTFSGDLNGTTKYGQHGPCLVAHAAGYASSVPLFQSVYDTIGSFEIDSADATQIINYSKNAILIANLKRTINPYGGNTYSIRQNSVYIATSNWQEVSSTETTYELDVFGGDTFIGLLDYPVTMQFQYKDIGAEKEKREYFGAYIPFESSINMNLLYGNNVHKTYEDTGFMLGWNQTDIVEVSDIYILDSPYYVYNSVYSVLPGSKKYILKSIYDESNVINTNRIICSELKTNSEITDSWTEFKFANYLDVDNKYGQITNLYLFKDRLYFFQNSAIGIASINDRSLISDNNIGALTLGTGDILARYDYLTSLYGSSIPNDKSIVSSDNNIYWYDFDKNEICALADGVLSLSKTKNVQLHLTTYSDTNKQHVVSLYDKQYNEVWFGFGTKSLIFAELSGSFNSEYSLSPDFVLPFSDSEIIIKDGYFYIQDTDIVGLTSLDRTSKITIVINKDELYTKTFDNIFFHGTISDPNNSGDNNKLYINFNTKSQTSETHTYDKFTYREDNYMTYIPREVLSVGGSISSNKSFLGRMRGKYLICTYTFDCNDNRSFDIPFITTTYRYSLI